MFDKGTDVYRIPSVPGVTGSLCLLPYFPQLPYRVEFMVTILPIKKQTQRNFSGLHRYCLIQDFILIHGSKTSIFPQYITRQHPCTQTISAYFCVRNLDFLMSFS